MLLGKNFFVKFEFQNNSTSADFSAYSQVYHLCTIKRSFHKNKLKKIIAKLEGNQILFFYLSITFRR